MAELSPELAALLAETSPYTCPAPGCGLGFSTLSTKKNHIREEHIQTKPKAKR